jgi:hypothetical protein
VSPQSNPAPEQFSSEQKKVIFAACLGTVFEWYDFFLYGSLADAIAKNFASRLDATSAFIFALLAFGVGLIVRPFGALVFGRLGDLVGRKRTFLITMLIMGVSTFCVGLLPGYATLGILAPIALIVLRMLQGLAVGGEYGGAASYLAEHAPPGRRGFYTSWLQTTSMIGLLLSLVVIVVCRQNMSVDDFNNWGWRIPFLGSVILLGISFYIRLMLNESPLFEKMKAEGGGTSAPLLESFGKWKNLKHVLIALFGLSVGQGVIGYCPVYSLFFLTAVLKIDHSTANMLLGLAIIATNALFVVCGWLSDKVGRKAMIMTGFAFTVLTCFPTYWGMTHFGNPGLEKAAATAPISIVADPTSCTVQFDPIGSAKYLAPCDIAKKALASRGLPFHNVAAPTGTPATIHIGEEQTVSVPSGGTVDASSIGSFNTELDNALKLSGYDKVADPGAINRPMVFLMLVVVMLWGCFVYGPTAAALTEFFPTRIRYTALSLPYHIGNGWFGGLFPATSFAIMLSTGNIYAGLWYPVLFTLLSLVVGMIFVRETKGIDFTKQETHSE